MNNNLLLQAAKWMNGDKELGFITKPKDTRTDKNAWRLHQGIGANNNFLGHEYNKGLAMKQVEKACGVVAVKA
jgi:hypothetical protein